LPSGAAGPQFWRELPIGDGHPAWHALSITLPPGGTVKALHVEDIMTRKVISLQADHSIHLASGVMQLQRIRHLPVLDGQRLVGLITHRDLLRAQAVVLAAPYDPRRDPSLSISVGQIMRTNVWTVTSKTPVLEAARIILDHKFGCLPVVDEDRLVGIVTEVDFIRCLVDGLTARREREDTDPIAVR
jgi:CBS domain-containing protein